MNAAADQNTLTISRIINAPRKLVWEAWTDPKHASQWWGPIGCTVTLFDADLRPGGRYRIDVDYGGAIGTIDCVYEEIVEFERVVTVGSLARDGVRLMDTRRVVTFEEDGGKTKITLCETFYNVTPEGADSVAGARQGMQQHFDRLEEYLLRK